MKALLISDMQIDFSSIGTMPIEEIKAIIPSINALMNKVDIVIATQQWHPANHKSFAANHLWRKPFQTMTIDDKSQLLLPIHCVQNSFGAELLPSLEVDRISKIIHKGTSADKDDYSAFYNQEKQDTGLNEYLIDQKIKTIYIVGANIESSLLYTAIDGLSLGYKVIIPQNACTILDKSSNPYKFLQKEGVFS